jgi:hypothetical protein
MKQMNERKVRHPKEGCFLISHSINHPLSAQRTILVAHSCLVLLWVQQLSRGNLKAFCIGGATPILECARVETANVKASFSSHLSTISIQILTFSSLNKVNHKNQLSASNKNNEHIQTLRRWQALEQLQKLYTLPSQQGRIRWGIERTSSFYRKRKRIVLT